ncbi:hypothetical protein CsSME_00041346 [Camellia sinensis var. sinensis]
MASCATTWSMSSLRSALPSVQRPHHNRPPSIGFSVGSSFTSPSSFCLRTSLPKSEPKALRSFIGLAPLNPLLSLTSEGTHTFPSRIYQLWPWFHHY